MDGFDSALALLPGAIRDGAKKMPRGVVAAGEEVRLRLGRTPTLLSAGEEINLPDCGPVESTELAFVLDKASDGSPYACTDSIASGYVCAAGGVRVGLCGEMRRRENGYVFSALSSVSVRIPRAVTGCAEGFVRRPVESTLLLSAPGGGKTTLLRDFCRLLGDEGERVGLCDERGEVAGMSSRGAGFDVGRCTDVLTGCRKGEGCMLLLRSMNPTVLAFDEITSPEDIAAMEYAAHCGVQLLATCHASGTEELHRRPLYASMLEKGIFSRGIVIENRAGRRAYREARL